MNLLFQFVTLKIPELYFKKKLNDADDFIQITIPPGAYETECLNIEIRRIFIHEEQSTESDDPFQIKPNFSTLGSIIENSPQGPIITFVFDDSNRNLPRFHETIISRIQSIT